MRIDLVRRWMVDGSPTLLDLDVESLPGRLIGGHTLIDLPKATRSTMRTWQPWVEEIPYAPRNVI